MYARIGARVGEIYNTLYSKKIYKICYKLRKGYDYQDFEV